MAELGFVTYNIHNGREAPTLLQNFQNFFDTGIDLVCLQELRLWHRGINLPELIAKTFGNAIQTQYFLDEKKDWYDFGLGFLWRPNTLKPLSYHLLTLPLPPKPKLWEYIWLRHLHKGITSIPVYRGASVATFEWNQKSSASPIYI